MHGGKQKLVLNQEKRNFSQQKNRSNCESEIGINFKKKRPTEFALEGLHQAIIFRAHELHVFGNSDQVPPPYLKAVLGEFELISNKEGFGAVIYPILKLFENGIILVQFRTIAPARKMELKNFIDRFVNLGLIQFDEVNAPPQIVDYAAASYNNINASDSIRERFKIALKEKNTAK